VGQPILAALVVLAVAAAGAFALDQTLAIAAVLTAVGAYLVAWHDPGSRMVRIGTFLLALGVLAALIGVTRAPGADFQTAGSAR
jgi:hypothetical protein